MIQSLLNRLSTLFNRQQLPWWVEIYTTTPQCLYYFGPFNSSQEARLHQAGYVEDLIQENAQGIQVEIKKCQPIALTLAEDTESAEHCSHENNSTH